MRDWTKEDDQFIAGVKGAVLSDRDRYLIGVVWKNIHELPLDDAYRELEREGMPIPVKYRTVLQNRLDVLSFEAAQVTQQSHFH